jgi:glycosyltransferase involved in cell wall biosynthesis
VSEPGLQVVHVTPRVQSRGGIETLHALHRTMPGDHAFVALFDRNPEARPGYVNLDCTWRTSLAEMRRRFARAMAPHAGRLVMYHNGWGLPLFHDLDGASRRTVMLHADPAYHAPDLPGFAGLIDGALSVAPAVAETVAAANPSWSAGRSMVCPVPIEAAPGGIRRGISPRWKLGYAGRIERAQKRLDRLPEFLRELRATGLDFQFELIGEGSFRPELQRELGSGARFHGWVSREEYWRVMATWDAVVFFSDHEGGPISLLEGMAAGALPFYPARFGSWADIYVPQVDPRFHYPPDDLKGLAQVIRETFSLPAAQVESRREAGRRLVGAHTPGAYQANCAAFLAHIAAAPRISGTKGGRRRLTDFLPLGMVTRFAPTLLSGPR